VEAAYDARLFTVSEEHFLRLPDAGLYRRLDEIARIGSSTLRHVVLLQIAQALRNESLQILGSGL
jgi:hypothetical protein